MLKLKKRWIEIAIKTIPSTNIYWLKSFEHEIEQIYTCCPTMMQINMNFHRWTSREIVHTLTTHLITIHQISTEFNSQLLIKDIQWKVICRNRSYVYVQQWFVIVIYHGFQMLGYWTIECKFSFIISLSCNWIIWII